MSKPKGRFQNDTQKVILGHSSVSKPNHRGWVAERENQS